jgi:glycosyltransferase involved in cell wall biosynthesis
MNTKKNTLITIGMPIFNCEKTIGDAIESLLNQTYTDFVLIISDNSSTDNTESICKKYALRDARIHYIRQPFNLGAIKNFNFVFDKAGTKYFMWAASDDIRSLDFLEMNFSFLEAHPDYVASTCPTRFKGDKFNSKSMGDASLVGDIHQRFVSYFNSWHANGRYYSLFRTQVLKKSRYIGCDFFGSDCAVMLSTIRMGKTHRCNNGFVVLGKAGFSNSGTIFKYYRTSLIHYFLPFYELIIATISMSADFPLRAKLKIYYALIKLNCSAIKQSAIIEIKNIYTRKQES